MSLDAVHHWDELEWGLANILGEPPAIRSEDSWRDGCEGIVGGLGGAGEADVAEDIAVLFENRTKMRHVS